MINPSDLLEIVSILEEFHSEMDCFVSSADGHSGNRMRKLGSRIESLKERVVASTERVQDSPGLPVCEVSTETGTSPKESL